MPVAASLTKTVKISESDNAYSYLVEGDEEPYLIGPCVKRLLIYNSKTLETVYEE